MGHTRQEFGQPEALVQPPESERLSAVSLVRGFTVDAAYQLHMEDEIGSIEVGKKADLVVLDQNVFQVDAYDIHETGVVLTTMDGEVVYARDPQSTIRCCGFTISHPRDAAVTPNSLTANEP